MDKMNLFTCKTAIELAAYKLDGISQQSDLVLLLSKLDEPAARKELHNSACQIDVDIGELKELISNLRLVLSGSYPEV